jgi:translin
VLTSVNKLQESLRAINEELKRTEERREKLLRETREVISLCSKSIVDMHYHKQKEAKEKLAEANTMLVEFRNYTTGDLQKHLSVPEQEFVEASTLMSIIEDSEVPGLPDLQVSGSAYIMGLLDCIGEIKRMVYDRVRAGSPEGAHDLFNFMEQIYSSVYPFAIYDNLVGGLKRKLDVAKILIEDVRVLLTEESRRENVIRAIEQLEERICGNRR